MEKKVNQERVLNLTHDSKFNRLKNAKAAKGYGQRGTDQGKMKASKANASSSTNSGISSVIAPLGTAMVTVILYLPWVVDHPFG